MKSVIASTLIFTALVSLIIINAFYIIDVGDTMDKKVSSLPSLDNDGTISSILELENYWDAHKTTVSLSVSFNEMNRVGDCISSLKSYAESDDEVDYECARVLLINAIREMKRLEHISPENIL